MVTDNKKLAFIIILTIIASIVVSFFLIKIFQKGELKITSENIPFAISINEKEYKIEKSPHSIKLKPGKHSLLAGKEGYEELKGEIEIKKGKIGNLNIELIPLSGESGEDIIAVKNFYIDKLKTLIKDKPTQIFGTILYNNSNNRFVVELVKPYDKNKDLLEKFFIDNTNQIYTLSGLEIDIIEK